MAQDNLVLLFVEDSEPTCDLMRSLMKGYSCKFAHNAKDGYLTYKELNPDITFIDIGLPDTAGFRLLDMIMKENPSAFVLMISSNSSVKAIDVAKKKGAQGFLSKPLARDKVEAYITLYKEKKGSTS